MTSKDEVFAKAKECFAGEILPDNPFMCWTCPLARKARNGCEGINYFFCLFCCRHRHSPLMISTSFCSPIGIEKEKKETIILSLKNGPFPAIFFFYFRLFNTQLTENECSI